MASAPGSSVGGPDRPRSRRPEERAPSEDNQDARPTSVKERMAMYEAAVSTKDSSSSAVAMDESEARSLPGGLTSVKRQFESHEFSSSQSSVSRVQVQRRSVQEVSSSSEVTVRSSSRDVGSTTTHSRQEVIHDQRAHQNSYGSHSSETVTLVGGEDLLNVSTQALKQQHEKTIEEAAPAKEIKVDVDLLQFQWAPVYQPPKTSAVTSYSASSAVRTVAASSVASSSSVAFDAAEHFPPPPTNLPQVTSEHSTSLHSQEKASQQKYVVSKEEYFKHKSMAELKRLYKHIHPEVRKNLEEDFINQLTDAERAALESKETVGDVQQTRYMFENDGSSSSGCSSPDREYLEWEEILKGEVQSMRWMFENKPLDAIKDDSPDESEGKNISQQEIIAGKDVRFTAWMFETQPMDALGGEAAETTEQSQKQTDLARGDVRTATWLFETQPLDCLNKFYQEDEQETGCVVTSHITGGDVKTARYLFETQHLDSLGKTETIEESHFLNLKSELEEIKGDVKMTTRMFETHPMCVIRGDSGEMLEITTIRREETAKGDVKTSRWMFETQPLDMINKDPAKVKLICGISMEDNTQGGVNKGRWLFETKTLDSINDEEWESSRKHKEEIIGADVKKHCLVFETQPMALLKDETNARPLPSEEIVGGDVQSAKHLFETVPMEHLKELLEVGKLKKTVALEEEKGDVRHQKWVFESQPLASIRDEKKELTRTVNIEAFDKGDVTNYKERFETMDLSKCEGTKKIQVEGVQSGSVRSNKVLFENTPMYAMQDSSGHYHEVRTVRREEIVKGDVHSCRWMFETRPIDEFDESINKFQIIKGISKQEVESGDVKTAKWLFETQPLDAIKFFSNFEDEEHKTKEEIEIEKGDVKTCRWLFETQPMDALYEKVEKSESDMEEVQKGDVKTCTWLFETQMLDNIRDHSETETILKTCTVKQGDIQGKDVQMARFLFETENLENITGEDSGSFRRVTEIDIHSGDVSRMKYIFENRSSDIMSSTSEETMSRLKKQQAEDIQRGNVVNCTWMFENQPIDAISEDSTKTKEGRTVTDVQGGDVNKGRFIFETYSLDEIKEESTETDISKLTSIFREDKEKGDVKNYTMMFETQPLYAIRDKEGHYHEVTTVTKEEILRGDVVGARWLFETKPLDSIRDSEEVYVIKAVTEEGVNKGDVSSAKWRFETQPLDEITTDIKVRLRTVADIQGGDVKTNKRRFEADEMSQKYIRTVSVSEIQKGDVRSATWMFETRTIDEIRGEGEEYDDMERVTKEEVMKGDVKQSVWLFERHPLDRIKESDSTHTVVTKEEIPQADVKTTTWLFETTPFHDFNESSLEKTEIIGKSVKETLEELYSQKMVDSQGILIEADEIGDVRMAKFKLMNQHAPQIQKEEIIRGDLSNIMMNLLNRRETTERVITIDKEERGDINTTVKQLFNQERGINLEKEAIIRGDIQEAMNNLLKNEGSSKRGILIQEDEKGDVKMTIYSLLNKGEKTTMEKEDIIHGNVSKTLQRLLSNSGEEDSKKIRVGEIERGNVSFYSTCIESGALEYLKQLQSESEEVQEEVQKEHIIGGDIEETKMLLRKNQQQIGRTVAEDDIVPGDVYSFVKVFMTEPAVTYRNLEKDIVKGDLNAALDSLTQAINQKVVIEKEEVVKGDLSTTLKSLEEAKNQAKETEKPEIIRGDIRSALESLEKSASAKTEASVEDLVPGDIKETLKSLEEAKQAVKEVEKEEIVRGDIYTAMQNLHEASNEKKIYQHQVSEQGDIKATIQLLMEPNSSPRMQRRGSVEGDVKTSIKSLYEGQETTHVEKEEVVKGDVQGAIKCLMQRKQYSNKKRTHPPKKAKEPMKNPSTVMQVEHESLHGSESENVALTAAPTVKNLSQSGESQRHHESKSLQMQVITQEDHSVAVVKTDGPAGAAHQKSRKEQKDKVLPPQKTKAPEPTVTKSTMKTVNNQTSSMKTVNDQTSLTKTVSDQTSLTKTVNDQTSSKKTVNDQTSLTKTVNDQMSLTKTVSDQTSLKKTVNDQTSLKKTVNDQTSLTKTVNDQTSSKKTVNDQMSSNKTVNDQTSSMKTVNDQTSLTKTVNDQMSLTKTVNDQTSLKKTVNDQTSLKKTVNDQTSSKKTVNNQTSSNKTVNDQTSSMKTVNDQTSLTKTVNDQMSLTKTVNDQTSLKKTVNDQTSLKKTVNDQTSSKKTVNNQTSSNKTVNDQMSSNKTVNNQTSSVKTVNDQMSLMKTINDQTSLKKTVNDQRSSMKTVNDQTSLMKTVNQMEKEAVGVNVMKETKQKFVSNKQIETKSVRQTVVTERTAVQQSVRNLKVDHRSYRGRGAVQRVTPEIHFPPPPSSPPPPSESDLSLPPPPSPVMESPASPQIMRQDSDLLPPPPPPPPPMDCMTPEFFPPPPPPPPPSSAGGHDFLPPPPSQQELNAMPQLPPAKPLGKPLFKVAKQPEPHKQPVQVKPTWQKKQPAPSLPPPQLPAAQQMEVMVHKEEAKVQEVKQETQQQTERNSQIKVAAAASPTRIPTIPAVKPEHKQSPQPPKKVFLPPIKLPPPPDPAPAPQSRPYARKFKTPLMLAEEKYRQQKEREDAERSVSTPASPSSNQSTTITAAESNVETTKVTMLSQDPPAKKSPSQIPLSKPSTSALNKKPTTAPSNVPSDKQQTLSTEGSVSKSCHESSEQEIQSCPSMVTCSVTEQQQHIQRSSSRSAAIQSTAQDHVNLQSPAAVTLKAEDVKNINVTLTPEGKTSPSQPTKIPKVPPSFKVKTFKMQTEKKAEKADGLGLKEMKIEAHSQQEKMSKKTESNSRHTSATTEMKETQRQATPTRKEAEVETKVRKGQQTNMAEVKLCPPGAQITSALTHQGQDLVSQSRQSVTSEHLQRHEEVVVTERTVQQTLQREEAAHVERQQLKLNAAETSKTQKKAKVESKNVSLKGPAKTAHKEEAPPGESSDLDKYTELEKLVAQIKELEGTPSRIDGSTVRKMVTDVPDWVLGSTERQNLGQLASQQSKKKLKEMLAYVKNVFQTKLTVLKQSLTTVEEEVKEELPVLPTTEKKPFTAASVTISKVSVASSRTEKKVVEETKVLRGSTKCPALSEGTDQRLSSPLASIRTPSPTYITIESRRVDSPLRVTPSPPPYKSVRTPPPPPRKSFTPTFSRATPSPTLSRSEKLMKLRDTTSKLSRGMTPPPPVLVPEYCAADREQSSPFSDRETPTERSDHGLMDVTEMVDSMMTVKDKKSFFEEAQKAEVNKMYHRKDPIDIPERLGPDAEDAPDTMTIELLKEDLPKVDLTKLVNKFESPQPTVYTRKDPIVITERLGSDTEEAEAEAHTSRAEEIPMFNVKAIKDVFETGEHGSQAARELREQIERRESESASSDPGHHSQTTSVTEQFCSVDDFGNVTRELRSEMHSGSSLIRGSPPSYADVVRGAIPTLSVPPEASTEELLRNFQQSWVESQGVFQNLGFNVTEQRTSQTVTHQETFVSGKPARAA